MRTLLFVVVILLAWLFLHREKSQADEPLQPMQPPPPNGNQDALESFAQAVFHYEGGKPGNRNVTNNNPGNLKAGPGMTGKAAGFATFDGQGGWDALKTYIAKHASQHPEWDFYDFFDYYLRGSTVTPATDSQGNSDAYAEYVAARVGVDPTQNVSAALGYNS